MCRILPISTSALILIMAALAEAQSPPFIFLPNDLTANGAAGGFRIIVGFESLTPGTVNTFRNPSSPTISFVEPGRVTSTLYVYNDSTVSADHSILTDVNMRDTSTLILQNDTVARIVTLSQQSKFIFNSGVVETLYANNSSNVTMSNGQIWYPDGGPGNSLGGFFFLSNSATATVTNSKIFGSASASGESNLSLVDSEVTKGVSASGVGIGATVTILSSFIGSETFPAGISAQQDGKIFVTSAGIYGEAVASGDSEISTTSSSFYGNLSAGDDSDLTLSSDTVYGNVTASGTASVVMTGLTDVKGMVFAEDEATIYMNRGFALTAIATGDSTLGIDGANFDQVHALGKGTINLGSSTVSQDVFAQQEGKINIDGDSRIDGWILATGESRVTMNNGRVVGTVSSSGSDAVFTLTGGSIQHGHCSSLGKFNMSGGDINQNLNISGDGTANFSGGAINGDLIVNGDGKAYMSGGHVAGAVRLFGAGKFFFSGGTFGTVSPSPLGGGSQLLLSEEATAGQGSGGMIIPSLIGNDSSFINLIGKSLEATLVDPNFEDLFSVYELSGHLADGTSIGGQFMYIQNETGASFRLVEIPEPSGIVLACFTALGLFLRRPQARRSINRAYQTENRYR